MITKMDFEDFDLNVEKYYPLNKSRTRFLVWFYSGEWAFYYYYKSLKCFIRQDSVLATLKKAEIEKYIKENN